MRLRSGMDWLGQSPSLTDCGGLHRQPMKLSMVTRLGAWLLQRVEVTDRAAPRRAPIVRAEARTLPVGNIDGHGVTQIIPADPPTDPDRHGASR